MPPKKKEESAERLLEDTFEITKTPNDEEHKEESVKSEEISIPDVSESYNDS